jgi:hypothetical protein
MIEPALPPRVVRGLAHRPAFGDALTWLEIHGEAPEAVASWRHVRTHATTPGGDEAAVAAETPDGVPVRHRRRRRRRRRGRRGGGGRPSES